jgi:hypothetical protein
MSHPKGEHARLDTLPQRRSNPEIIRNRVPNVVALAPSSATQHCQPPFAGDHRQLLIVIPVPQYTTHAFGLGALSPGG